jgi:hypothetical protein
MGRKNSRSLASSLAACASVARLGPGGAALAPTHMAPLTEEQLIAFKRDGFHAA